ncbi:hypothetical protein Bpfe_003569 [Biomphalaria pfeifferi]|uniref:ZP domain-containing protein n=1 Tax=Biomphalaria pfeifferi TaxID=112525 RepID=A0AAD8C770_BIOPF|nr:hypothetical protein Bpfe_003569 [Biomphalaria pfeifferi]
MRSRLFTALTVLILKGVFCDLEISLSVDNSQACINGLVEGSNQVILTSQVFFGEEKDCLSGVVFQISKNDNTTYSIIENCDGSPNNYYCQCSTRRYQRTVSCYITNLNRTFSEANVVASIGHLSKGNRVSEEKRIPKIYQPDMLKISINGKVVKGTNYDTFINIYERNLDICIDNAPGPSTITLRQNGVPLASNNKCLNFRDLPLKNSIYEMSVHLCDAMEPATNMTISTFVKEAQSLWSTSLFVIIESITLVLLASTLLLLAIRKVIKFGKRKYLRQNFMEP